MNNKLADERVNHYAENGFDRGYNRRDIQAMAVELQELRRILSGLPQDAIDGGWTAAGISAYAARLESELQERRKVDLRKEVRADHAAWADMTFGSIGPVGPLKHLSKEALEAAAAPGDLSEWADMQFLLWDAQRRAGISDEQITQAMVEKLAVNKTRQWPEPKDGEPRLHIKEGSNAPQELVVPDENADPRDIFETIFPIPKYAQRCGKGYACTAYSAWGAHDFIQKWEGWNACYSLMLQGGAK